MAVDRQTLVFFIIMFIFLSLPTTGEEPYSDKDRETLKKFEERLVANTELLKNATYDGGYGYTEGLLLSYQDSLDGKNISHWPFHIYDTDHPFIEDQKYSILPNIISDRLKSFWATNSTNWENPDEKAYILNATGAIKGTFEKTHVDTVVPVNIPLPDFLQDYAEKYTSYRRKQDNMRYDDDGNPIEEPDQPLDLEPLQKEGNMSFNTGTVRFVIGAFDYNYRDKKLLGLNVSHNHEDWVEDAVITQITLFFSNEDESETHRIDTGGVYLQDTGSFLTTTTSGKFFSFGAPHLSIYKKYFPKLRKLWSQYTSMEIRRRIVTMDELNDMVLATEKCEYICYLQLSKTNFTFEELRSIDNELQYPSGKPMTKEFPKLELEDYILYSPDCGIILEKPKDAKAEGNLIKVLYMRARKMLLGVLVLLFIQMIALIRQTQQIKTPGQLSAISSTTVSILGFQDSLLAVLFFLSSTIISELYLLIVSCSVIAFFMSGFFETTFLVEVLMSQQNETGSWWDTLRGSMSTLYLRTSTEANAQAPTTTTQDAAAPVQETPTVPTPTQPPATQDDAGTSVRVHNGIFGRTFFFTLVAAILLVNSISWSNTGRRVFEICGYLFINSYWFPQFLRNTLKNRRRSFLWEFIIVTSLIRIAPVYYFNFVKNNALDHRLYDYFEVFSVTFWLLLQIELLYLQEIFGARFWINEKWLPKAYNYHPILNVGDLENGFSSDVLANIRELESEQSNENEDSGVVTCKVGCAICMTDIELPVIVDPELTKANNSIDKLKALQYMITPCHHMFHSECLEDWMKYKLQCPVCRTSLPPVF